MTRLFALLLCFVTLHSHASVEDYFSSPEMSEICEKSGGVLNGNQIMRSRPRFSRVGDDLYVVYINREEGGFDLVHFSKEAVTKRTVQLGKMRDIKVTKESIWVAREYSVDQYELESLEKLGTYQIVQRDSQVEGSVIRAFEYKDGMIYTVHGIYGLSVFDTNKNRTQLLHGLDGAEDGSMAVNLAMSDDHLYVAMATSRPKGFTGIITLKNEKIISKAKYDYRKWGVIYIAAQMTAYKDHVLLNNGGWAHLFTTKELLTSKVVQPKWLAIQETLPEGTFYLSLQGEVVLGEGSAYGCASLSYKRNEEPTFEARIFKKEF